MDFLIVLALALLVLWVLVKFVFRVAAGIARLILVLAVIVVLVNFFL